MYGNYSALAEDNAENTGVGDLDKLTLILLTALFCCIIIYRKYVVSRWQNDCFFSGRE